MQTTSSLDQCQACSILQQNLDFVSSELTKELEKQKALKAEVAGKRKLHYVSNEWRNEGGGDEGSDDGFANKKRWTAVSSESVSENEDNERSEKRHLRPVSSRTRKAKQKATEDEMLKSSLKMERKNEVSISLFLQKGLENFPPFSRTLRKLETGTEGTQENPPPLPFCVKFEVRLIDLLGLS